ncbi:DUF1705 domain-containing protein [Acinetobacter lwoffii]|uniref:DUF1705 domain-containing protein n=1 Tax=Acinetobacter lwoffii TaxID=28090 RepID=UPI002269C96A|nr:DUF1705 domain-containing protein [Acinetobacter lwoffii]
MAELEMERQNTGQRPDHLGGFSAYFVNSLGVVITPDQIQNMLQTDAREVRDLWSMRLVIWTLVFVVFPLFIIWMLKIQPASLGISWCIKA